MSSASRASGHNPRARLNPISRLVLAATLPALLFACGGGGGGGGGAGLPFAPIAVAPTPDVPPPPPPAPPPPVAPPPAAQTTTLVPSVDRLALSANNPGLNAALTGAMRTITITNTGLYDAKGLTATVSPALPAGASYSTNCGGVLPAGGSCQVTVSPGLTPTAAALVLAPAPSTLRVTGDNTSASITDIHILSYGSVYQAGYVFTLDDTTAPTGSVGGKVLALSPDSNGERWGPDGQTTGVPYGDGRATTQALVALFQGQPSAARTCASSSTGGYSDWYLPGLCEVLHCSQPMNLTLLTRYFGSDDPSIFYWLADPQPQGNPPSITTANSYSVSMVNHATLRSDLKPTRCVRDLLN